MNDRLAAGQQLNPDTVRLLLAYLEKDAQAVQTQLQHVFSGDDAENAVDVITDLMAGHVSGLVLADMGVAASPLDVAQKRVADGLRALLGRD